MPEPILSKQNVVNLDSEVGAFMITEQMILEIPFDNFVDFGHALEDDARARKLDVLIEDHPNGIIIYWKPSV